MTLSPVFELPEGSIDRVRLGPKEDFNYRFLRPLEGDYVDVQGNIFSAQETFDAGYVPFTEPVCSGVVSYGGDFTNANVASGQPGSFVVVPTVALNSALNTPVEYDFDINAPDGQVYGVTMEVTRLVNGGTPSFNTSVNNVATSGNNDYRFRLIAKPDVLGNVPELHWNIRPASLNGGGENFQIQAGIDTYPTDFISGGQNNAPQADWDNQTGIFANGASFVYTNINNASNASAFLFVGSDVSFRLNAQAGVGASMTITLLRGPSFDVCLCDRMGVVEELVQEIPLLAPTATGIYSLGRFPPTPSAPINVNNTNIVTGLDLTQATGMTLRILSEDLTAGRGWQIAEIDVDSMLARFNAGDVADARALVFDNDFLILNVVDPVTGEINFTDNGREIQISWIELYGRAIPTTPSYVQASLVGQNGNQANAVLTLATDPVVKGTQLQITGDTFEVIQPCFSVELSASATYLYDTTDTNNAALQRVSLLLELFKNGVRVAVSATGYQRHATGHNESSNNAVYTDLNPVVGDLYTVVATQGSVQVDVLPISFGQFTAKAY